LADQTNKVIERRIDFTAPNTIGLAVEKWEKTPVSFHIRDIPLYCCWVAGLLLIALLAFLHLNLGTILTWIGSTVVILGGGYYAERTLRRKHRESQLRYREEYVPLLAELLEANGLIIPKEEQQKLTSTMKTKFKVFNEDGLRYRTSGIDAYGDTLSGVFFLSDPTAEEALLYAAREETIGNIVQRYEAEQGEFASPELRSAFIEGVRQTLR
jgi:hypothetical protein